MIIDLNNLLFFGYFNLDWENSVRITGGLYCEQADFTENVFIFAKNGWFVPKNGPFHQNGLVGFPVCINSPYTYFLIVVHDFIRATQYLLEHGIM